MQDIRILGCSMYRPVDFIQQRLIALAKQLEVLKPDVICLQELFHPDLQQQLYSSLQSIYPHVTGFAKTGFKLRLGNELITFSKFPLKNENLIRFSQATTEERLFTSKGIYQMTLESPIGEIQLINMHMTAGGLRHHPEDHRLEKMRANQIQQMLASVTNNAPTLLVGDLNAGPDSSRTNYLSLLEKGYTDAFTEVNGSGNTWDPGNPLVASNNESHLPTQRVDHIFLNQAALKLFEPVSGNIVLNEHSIDLSSGEKIPISDHYGLLVNFKTTHRF